MVYLVQIKNDQFGISISLIYRFCRDTRSFFLLPFQSLISFNRCERDESWFNIERNNCIANRTTAFLYVNTKKYRTDTITFESFNWRFLSFLLFCRVCYCLPIDKIPIPMPYRWNERKRLIVWHETSSNGIRSKSEFT